MFVKVSHVLIFVKNVVENVIIVNIFQIVVLVVKCVIIIIFNIVDIIEIIIIIYFFENNNNIKNFHEKNMICDNLKIFLIFVFVSKMILSL